MREMPDLEGNQWGLISMEMCTTNTTATMDCLPRGWSTMPSQVTVAKSFSTKMYTSHPGSGDRLSSLPVRKN